LLGWAPAPIAPEAQPAAAGELSLAGLVAVVRSGDGLDFDIENLDSNRRHVSLSLRRI
jgi:hypothetical protein